MMPIAQLVSHRQGFCVKERSPEDDKLYMVSIGMGMCVCLLFSFLLSLGSLNFIGLGTIWPKSSTRTAAPFAGLRNGIDTVSTASGSCFHRRTESVRDDVCTP
ncbi:hypothetical protein BDV29DRAFT_40192 [Aspergillus leporis]|uniref:Uncharacterized protein n=1 Tax=Aspergillus leporis TaxID=41062 RepID=A0A5N5WND3_9EURO|nr:hypothetical protein BDV29DRAFT_40192 [Aspergillus leporis]